MFSHKHERNLIDNHVQEILLLLPGYKEAWNSLVCCLCISPRRTTKSYPLGYITCKWFSKALIYCFGISTVTTVRTCKQLWFDQSAIGCRNTTDYIDKCLFWKCIYSQYLFFVTISFLTSNKPLMKAHLCLFKMLYWIPPMDYIFCLPSQKWMKFDYTYLKLVYQPHIQYMRWAEEYKGSTWELLHLFSI